MSKELQYSKPYKDWLNDIKLKIRVSRMKVALAANTELILFYWELYNNDLIVQRSVGQIPWRHNVLIVSKTISIEEALFYISKTVKNGWSSDVLANLT